MGQAVAEVPTFTYVAEALEIHGTEFSLMAVASAEGIRVAVYEATQLLCLLLQVHLFQLFPNLCQIDHCQELSAVLITTPLPYEGSTLQPRGGRVLHL